MNPLKVAAFTQGLSSPPARFRVRFLLPALKEHGIDVREWPARHGSYPPETVLPRVWWLPRTSLERLSSIRGAKDADVALFQREMVSTLAFVEWVWRKPAVLDVDDAVWLSQRFRSVDRLALRVSGVICGNSYLADYFSHVGARTWILPTAVDTGRFQPVAAGSDPVIVWSGSSPNLSYLNDIEDAISVVLSAVRGARLRVVCDLPPRLKYIPPQKVEFVRWSPSVEVSALQSARVGIMPMPDTAWTRGKCSLKMLTYMATGLPVVVSSFGMNREVLARGEVGFGATSAREWSDALIAVLRDEDLAARMGTRGREIVVQEFSTSKIGGILASILREVSRS